MCGGERTARPRRHIRFHWHRGDTIRPGLVSKLRAAKLRVPINDSWIAATAVAHGIAILTQDNDYAAMPDVEVITI